MKPPITFGEVISADTNNFVRYCKYAKQFAVAKALFTGNDDSDELYKREIRYQELLAEKGFAPKILRKKVNATTESRRIVIWVSEDAGLPIEDEDIPAANELLDKLYDMGIILHWIIPRKDLFVKGFDGVIRVTDFKQTEMYDEPIAKHNRKYVMAPETLL